MRVVHETDSEERTVASDVELADSLLKKGVGLMFHRSIGDDYALVFPFSRAKRRGLHMLCVPFDIDALWLVDGRVEAVERLPAWTGHGRARADLIVELPAGAAERIEVGDRVRVEAGSTVK